MIAVAYDGSDPAQRERVRAVLIALVAGAAILALSLPRTI